MLSQYLVKSYQLYSCHRLPFFFFFLVMMLTPNSPCFTAEEVLENPMKLVAHTREHNTSPAARACNKQPARERENKKKKNHNKHAQARNRAELRSATVSWHITWSCLTAARSGCFTCRVAFNVNCITREKIQMRKELIKVESHLD